MAEFGYVLLFINIILYLSKYSKQKELPFKILFLYMLTIGVILYGGEHYQASEKGNLFLTHYYFISQSLLFSFFYYQIVQSPKIKKLIKIIVPTTLISLAIQYSIYPDLYYVFNVYEIFICIIPIVIYAISHLFQTLENSNKKYIYITSGVLIYFLPHALVFSSGNLMPNLPNNVNEIIWLVNVFLYIVYLILIFVEWYKHFRKNPVITHENN
jgi:hypothetical protein